LASQALYRMSGVDLTTIDGIGVETAAIVMSELGTDGWRLVRYGQPYMDAGVDAYEKRFGHRRLLSYTRRLKEMGYEIVPLAVSKASK